MSKQYLFVSIGFCLLSVGTMNESFTYGKRASPNSKLGEVGLAYHVSQAPDEMIQLANELRTLVDQAGLPVPAIRKVLVMQRS